jgi:4-hydroxy-3-methylbut-2-enyl diphosphate reductase
MTTKPPLKIVLCSPRGFCAGVVRAIDTVERALTIHGAPVYVRHEIVHNKYVVDSLKTKGAIFVEELAEIPDNTTAPVVFSAHGVPKSVPADAKERNFFSLDATCPLVTKVHREAAIHFKRGREILLIGHSHHPEVVGTVGQLPPGAVQLIETAGDAETFMPKDPDNLAFVTQTTLSIDDTAEIVAVLKRSWMLSRSAIRCMSRPYRLPKKTNSSRCRVRCVPKPPRNRHGGLHRCRQR